MSVIKTASGYVELGAANPIERAFETVGFRGERFTPCKPEPVLLTGKELLAEVRRVLIRSGDIGKVGVKVNRDGSVTFGKYAPFTI